MKLGGRLYGDCRDPDTWVKANQDKGYTAAYCPVGRATPDDIVRAYADAAQKAGITISEVGAWSNTISPDKRIRGEAILQCQEQLSLAEKVGAKCCVNIAGSRGDQWDGPHPDNFSPATFDLIVETVREIIDGVNPSRAFYTLETMPWVFPATPAQYLALIEAIDRKMFGVHLDIVNMITSPEIYYDNASLIRESITKLGPHIVACHAKDVILSSKLLVHLEETAPGQGGFDFRVFLEEMNKLPVNTPVLLEHLETEDEYDRAADYLRSAARNLGIEL